MEDDPEAKRQDREDDSDEEAAASSVAARSRDDELTRDDDLMEDVRKAAEKAKKGFENQWERDNDELDYWDIYDQIIGGKQAYAGNHTVYLPIVYQAIEARVTRFVNQVFPRSGRNVDCITSDDKPYDLLALLEHYIRKCRLRTQVIPAMMRNGDMEGQYNIYVGWETNTRYVVEKTDPKLSLDSEDGEPPMEITIPADDDEEMDIEEIEIEHMYPTVEVLPDCDVLVLPHNSSSVGAALEKGGLVAIVRRWTQERLEQAIDDDEIDATEGEALLKEMASTSDAPGQQNATKKHISAAGITTGEGGKLLIFYELWKKIKVDGVRRLVRCYYAGGDAERVFSLRLNPYWCDKCPLLSAPQKKVSNVFKGVSMVKPVADLQYAANDSINEGLDSADYAVMPIIMTDPAKNPRVGSMVLNLAAIWETSPNDTKFAQIPPLWKDALTIVNSIKQEIFQILSVSPAMLPQQTGGKSGKRNQAEIAMEQQIDILSTADVCTNCEDEILTPLLRWFVDLDYQYRKKNLTVRQYGQMGVRADMQDVKPIQNSRRFEFRWWGVEAARNSQQIQLQVSAINVVKGIPPQMYAGHQLNIAPFISLMLENAFGPRLVPQIWTNVKDQLSVDPETENGFLEEGLTLPVHMLDEDRKHMQVHLQALKNGDPSGSIRDHLLLHRMQMSQKLQKQQQQMAQMQQGGGPGGQGGGPRPGAQPGQARGGQQPPGAIHSDRMQDPGAAPRR